MQPWFNSYTHNELLANRILLTAILSESAVALIMISPMITVKLNIVISRADFWRFTALQLTLQLLY